MTSWSCHGGQDLVRAHHGLLVRGLTFEGRADLDRLDLAFEYPGERGAHDAL